MDRRAIAGIFALLVGVASAALLAPALFASIPTDLSRIGVLLRASEERAAEPRMVFLGNSVIMDGVDARAVSEALPNAPLAYNYASTGQTLVESYLLYQEIPPSVTRLVQAIMPVDLARPPRLPVQKYNAYYMYGYRPDERTASQLTSIFGPPLAELFAASELSQRFRSRWALRQLVDTSLRRLLRPDLALDAATTDLFFPSARAKPLPPSKRERLLRRWFENWSARSFESGAENRALLGAMLAWGSSRGTDLVLLLPPVHPWIRAQRGDDFYRDFRRSVSQLADRDAVVVIDALDLLETGQFADHQHATVDGAAVLSRFIADRLRESGQRGAGRD